MSRTRAGRRSPHPGDERRLPRAEDSRRLPPRPARSVTAGPYIPPAAARFALPIALISALLVHGPALGTCFAQDDVTFLSRARGLLPTPWSFARPLSEAIAWRGLNALFGLSPLPYHLFNLALHLANVAMVFAIGRRLLGGRGAACAAAVLFGASTIAFTPLHWATCLVELLTASFALGALLLYLQARERGSSARLWLSALSGLAAALSKESAILFPLALLAADRRSGLFPPAKRSLTPALAAAALFAAAFLATLRLVRYIGTEAYSMTASPAFIAGNLATYLRWLAALNEPIRDAAAFMHPEAWGIGALVALVGLIALWTQRRAARHPEEIGAIWFLAFLLPVLPLRFHTYLYYLYIPWAGACWMIAGTAARWTARGSRVVAWAAAAGLVAFVGVEMRNAHAREHATIGDFAADRTVRESGMIRNVVASLDSANLAEGTAFALVNPARLQHFALVPGASGEHSYLPLDGALRGGQTMTLFFPRLRYLGLGPTIPPEWERAEIFLGHADGTLRPLGRGSRALAELGTFALRLREWDHADSVFERSLALGDTVPDAIFGLIITRDFRKHAADSRAFAAEFLRRWPDDPRAHVVEQGLKTGAGANDRR